jgi:arylsulfatase A-like enzyme
MPRKRAAVAAALAALALALWLGYDRHVPPNVLLVTIDTLRWDRLGAYGHASAATPVLDGLARRGVRFTTAIAHAPLTAPSHASILTGRNPLGHGVRDNGAFALPKEPRTLAEVFRDAGYSTAAFVSGFPLDHRYGFARGFETYDDRLQRGSDSRRAPYVERSAADVSRSALAWMKGARSPWLAWVHYFDPHAPYDPPPDLLARFAASPYDGEIASVDRELGALLKAADTGAYRTLVLVTSDHGESLGEHGEATHGVFVYDATLRVPFLLAGAGVARGRVSDVVARGIDVLPTLVDYAGLAVPHGVDGRSLRPAANGKVMADAPAYAESLFCSLNLGWSELHALRSARYKLIEAPRAEFYDVVADPGELRDVLDANAGEAEALRAGLRQALETRPPDAAHEPGTEARERLRALGYVGGSAPSRPTGRDPKDGIALVEQLERGLAEARANPALAIDELTAFLAAEPDAPLARRHRAIAYQFAGRQNEAIADIRALEASGPLRLEDQTVLAESLRLAGRGKEALAVLDQAREANPQAPEPLLLRGRTLRALGRDDDARMALWQALKLDPKNAEARRLSWTPTRPTCRRSSSWASCACERAVSGRRSRSSSRRWRSIPETPRRASTSPLRSARAGARPKRSRTSKGRSKRAAERRPRSTASAWRGSKRAIRRERRARSATRSRSTRSSPGSRTCCGARRERRGDALEEEGAGPH